MKIICVRVVEDAAEDVVEDAVVKILIKIVVAHVADDVVQRERPAQREPRIR